jgi:NAD(P)-dependent dehydrogenase (short-subunit alcohol dehydrogenase family)
MDLQLTDRHVLITGGSKGIGLACALAFCHEGARVSLVARDVAALEAAQRQITAAGGRASIYSADLRSAADAAAVVTRIYAEGGEVDVLVNSSGAAVRTPFDELTPQAWHAAMEAKFFAYIHVIDPVIKKMGARSSGAIVNVIGSGGKVASPTHLGGGAANAALMLATAGLAAAYGPFRVRVNAVNPGPTLTARLEQGLAAEERLQNKSAEDVLAGHQQRIPLRRLATPEEVANAVLFLASPSASYVTGAIVSMDGGVNPIVV